MLWEHLVKPYRKILFINLFLGTLLNISVYIFNKGYTYLGMRLLEGDPGAVEEWGVSEEVGGGSREAVGTARLIVQDSRETDVNGVLQGLQLRLLPNNNNQWTAQCNVFEQSTFITQIAAGQMPVRKTENSQVEFKK